MVIWLLLRVGRRGAGGEIGNNHVGENGARLGNVESSESRIHRGLPEILASPQEFCVYRADLLEHAAQLAGVVDQLGNLKITWHWARSLFGAVRRVG
jgi:hypothetical protein